MLRGLWNNSTTYLYGVLGYPTPNPYNPNNNTKNSSDALQGFMDELSGLQKEFIEKKLKWMQIKINEKAIIPNEIIEEKKSLSLTPHVNPLFTQLKEELKSFLEKIKVYVLDNPHEEIKKELNDFYVKIFAPLTKHLHELETKLKSNLTEEERKACKIELRNIGIDYWDELIALISFIQEKINQPLQFEKNAEAFCKAFIQFMTRLSVEQFSLETFYRNYLTKEIADDIKYFDQVVAGAMEETEEAEALLEQTATSNHHERFGLCG